VFFRKKKRPEKKLKRAAIPHVFLVLGFFGAALTSEVINILHEWAQFHGSNTYLAYSAFIVLFLWPLFIIEIMRLIEYLYSEK